MSIEPISRILALLIVVGSLAACVSDPPALSMQAPSGTLSLRRADDGVWTVSLGNAATPLPGFDAAVVSSAARIGTGSAILVTGKGKTCALRADLVTANESGIKVTDAGCGGPWTFDADNGALLKVRVGYPARVWTVSQTAAVAGPFLDVRPMPVADGEVTRTAGDNNASRHHRVRSGRHLAGKVTAGPLVPITGPVRILDPKPTAAPQHPAYDPASGG